MSKSNDMTSGMKSAYELALEKLESQGIERPDENLSQDIRDRAAEIRSQAAAKLAELEILHRDTSAVAADPAARAEAEAEYVAERQRIETRRNEKIEALRGPRS